MVRISKLFARAKSYSFHGIKKKCFKSRRGGTGGRAGRGRTLRNRRILLLKYRVKNAENRRSSVGKSPRRPVGESCGGEEGRGVRTFSRKTVPLLFGEKKNLARLRRRLSVFF